jgi:hypothetical protein
MMWIAAIVCALVALGFLFIMPLTLYDMQCDFRGGGEAKHSLLGYCFKMAGELIACLFCRDTWR